MLCNSCVIVASGWLQGSQEDCQRAGNIKVSVKKASVAKKSATKKMSLAKKPSPKKMGAKPKRVGKGKAIKK